MSLKKAIVNHPVKSNVQIGGYELTTQFVASGNARWAFAEKDGLEYFIKEHISPVYKTKEDGFPPSVVLAYKKICDSYYLKKKKLYDAVQDSSNGNIVYVMDFFRFGNKFYSVSERVPGIEATPQLIQSMKQDQKLILLKILANSVLQLHNHGVIHGDLKPSNILLKKTGHGYTLKLIDFDASFLTSDLPGRNLQLDQLYAAPETVLYANEEDVPLTTKADIFSLGLVFHYYCTGTLPALPNGVSYPHEAVLLGNTLHCSSAVPVPVARLIEKMICLEPDDRPSIQAVFKQLTQDSNGDNNSTIKLSGGLKKL